MQSSFGASRESALQNFSMLAAAQKGFSCSCAAVLSKRLLDGRQRYRIAYKLVKINLMVLYYALQNAFSAQPTNRSDMPVFKKTSHWIKPDYYLQFRLCPLDL